MFGTSVDTAIGLVLTFLLFSILLTVCMESIAAVLTLRSRALEDQIAKLIENPSVAATGWAELMKIFGAHKAAAKQGAPPAPLGDAAASFPLSYEHVYEHPMVAGDRGLRPSYVPGANFASALTQVVGVIGGGANFHNVATGVAKLENPQLRTALETLLNEAAGDLGTFRAGVERWFDNAMDRLSGSYKRSIQVATLLVGFGLAAALNVDTVHVARSLYADPALRASMVAAAQKQVDAPPKPHASAGEDVSAQVKKIPEAEQYLASVAPIGWAGVGAFTLNPREANGLQFDAWVLVGWLLTAVAGLMGAPFWFDALGALVNVRNAGPKPKSSTSQDK
ncbi:MAG TPA: hypothetical protein VFE13_04005 [Caulobacteraceae bacterium]|jgi:hypothetical protein|nr:hypothetical protein [Caulobacteraceae bacterium]